MFQREGAGRDERQNQILAGSLALIGGFVNSAGFVLVGTFTSHVTGNVGRFSTDVTTSQFAGAATALMMCSAFLIGALVASMIVESKLFGRISTSYAIALFGEAFVLLLFTFTSTLTTTAHPRLLDLAAAILCGAMGMQNSLVSRLSGAVVRTTHLTGVFTDIGVEGARWFRWWRYTLSEIIRVRLYFGQGTVTMPAAGKIKLLLTIAATFTTGAVLGACAAVRFRHLVMLIPSSAVAAGAVYALLSGRARHQQP